MDTSTLSDQERKIVGASHTWATEGVRRQARHARRHKGKAAPTADIEPMVSVQLTGSALVDFTDCPISVPKAVAKKGVVEIRRWLWGRMELITLPTNQTFFDADIEITDLEIEPEDEN